MLTLLQSSRGWKRASTMLPFQRSIFATTKTISRTPVTNGMAMKKRSYATPAKETTPAPAAAATEGEKPHVFWSLFPGSVNSNLSMKERAIELLDMIPGKTRADKAGVSVLGLGMASYLHSENVVNLDDQSVWTAALIVTIRFLFVVVKKPVQEYYAQQAARELELKERKVNNAMKEHKDYMEYLESHKGMQGVVDEYYKLCKDIETDLVAHSNLMRQNMFLQKLKDSMDFKLKYDNRLLQVSRERVVGHTIERVQERLQDPAVQTAILNQCLDDLKAVKTK